jgi:hypothetical protein
MAIFEQAILGMDVLTLLFVFITLIHIKKSRDFEKVELENSLNALMFGVFLLLIMVLINTFISLDTNFHASLVVMLPEIDTYLGYLMNITDLALLPLFGVCFLVAVLIVRHQLPKEEKS